MPIIAALTGETVSQPAVIATRPANEPFNVIETSGLPYLIQVKIIVVTVATAAAMFVVTKILPADTIASPSMDTVEQPLNPNQQNHKIKQPNAPNVNECPGMALGFPFLSYLPIRGPSIFAPISAATPPVMWTAVEPAKSWKPNSDSQPPPQIQWASIGYTIALITALYTR